MMTTSDQLLRRLTEWGVRRVYGYPGDGINGIIGALDRTDGAIEFVQVRHEEQAAFMACAHAKFTGEVGYCLATSGPGAIHLLNGLYDAKMDHVPVVAIVGQAATCAIGGDYQQEVDLHALFKDVASEYLVTINDPLQVRMAVDRAVRTALSQRTVTTIIMPKNVQEMRAQTKPPHKHNTVHTSLGYARPRVIPPESALKRAAEVLNAGSRVAMLVGAGAAGASGEIRAVADRLGAGCAKALLGKAVLPDDLPWVTGTIGLLGTRASSDMMSDCDTLLMIGSSFPYGEFLPKEGQARGVQIEVDARRVGLRYPMEVNLVGDASETLRALLPLLEAKTDGQWRRKIAEEKNAEAEIDRARAELQADPINPERLFTELSPRLPDRCIITADAGTSTNWLARHLKMREGMMFSLSGSLATMGSAVPYAIAAKFAYPDRPVIALTGDGAMQMNGMNELITAARYWRKWSNSSLIFMVNNNRDLNQVSWEMRIESGEPRFLESQQLPDFPYSRYAELLGFTGIRIDRPEQIGDAWDRALSAKTPVVLEAFTDPNVSLLPPHISLEQARSFMSAMWRGDPDRTGAIVESVKSMAAGVIPGVIRAHEDER